MTAQPHPRVCSGSVLVLVLVLVLRRAWCCGVANAGGFPPYGSGALQGVKGE